MSVLMFVALAASVTQGQAEFTTAGGSTSWVVPGGVTEIHAVAVGGSNNTESSIKRGSTTLLSCNSAVGTAFGGGNGGAANTNGGSGTGGGSNSGGGGAGGYSGNGGWSGAEAASGIGGAGAGGGGGGGASSDTTSQRQNGGGVYLHGEGASGAGGLVSPSTLPGAGSNLGEGVPVGAGRRWTNASNLAQAGGNLRYTKTAIAVTPGETLTIAVGTSPSTGGDATTGGGVRIIWGAGRSYPSNAKDV